MADSDGLENRCPERDRGFESHPLRHTKKSKTVFQSFRRIALKCPKSKPSTQHIVSTLDKGHLLNYCDQQADKYEQFTLHRSLAFQSASAKLSKR